MGCDIHMLSQVKKGDTWVTYDTDIFSDRSYSTFGILAGVRSSEYEPISLPKGIPEGCKLDEAEYGCDYYSEGFWLGEHSLSWINLKELEAYDWDQKTYEDYTLKDFYIYTNIIPYMRALAEQYGGPENVRIVFGFDS